MSTWCKNLQFPHKLRNSSLAERSSGSKKCPLHAAGQLVLDCNLETYRICMWYLCSVRSQKKKSYISSRFVCSRVSFIFIDSSTHTKVVQCHWVDECAWWRYHERESNKEDKFIHNLHLRSSCPCADHENKCRSEYIPPIILNLDTISWWVVTFMSRLLYPWENSNWYKPSWSQRRSGHLGIEKKL